MDTNSTNRLEFDSEYELEKTLFPVWKQLFQHSFQTSDDDEWTLLKSIETKLIDLPSNQLKIHFLDELRKFIKDSDLSDTKKEFLERYMEIRADILFRMAHIQEYPTMYLNPEITNQVEFVKVLYDKLGSNGFIKCDHKTFERHFTQTDYHFELIEWYDFDYEIANLVYHLHAKRFIFCDSWVRTIYTHFKDANPKGDYTKKAFPQIRTKGRDPITESILKELAKIYLPKIKPA